MLSAETKRHLAKAMALAQQEDHELLVLNFNRAPQPEESGVEVLCSMKDTTPENIAQLAQEALGFFAHHSLIIN